MTAPAKERILELDLEKDFPSLELAYNIAIASYETSQKRMDAVDSKTQSLTALCITSFIALPTIARAWNVTFQSFFFYASMLLIFVSIIFSIISLRVGTVDRLDPSKLWDDEWLDYPRGQFMKDAIYHAGGSLKKADETIIYKWNMSNLALRFYFAAIFAGAFWLAIH